MSADNQQERLKITSWITGFVDGEGCFSISIFRNKTSKLGWQIFPEFAVTQGEKSLASLKLLKNFFGCGKIFINRRHDNHKENALRTSKAKDFLYFGKCLDLIEKRKHLSKNGMKRIGLIVQTMNRKKTPLFLE